MADATTFDPVAYWKRTLRRTVVLLSIWFLVGPVMGILLAEPLNNFRLGGIPFGFWMAQQGSIYVFVILIFVYAWRSDRADREAGVHETPETTRTGTEH
jgi:putative solute:sodium symporter small subunit